MTFADSLQKMAFDRQIKYVEKDWSHLKNPVGSKKYDGSHFTLTVQDDGSFTFHSRRKGVDGTHPERSAQVPHLNDRPLPQYAGTEMSVELIHTGHDPKAKERHNILSGILNSKVERALQTQHTEGPVRAVLLNVKKANEPLHTYEDKIRFMKKFEEDFGKPDLMFTPEYHYGHEAIKALSTRLAAAKHEGIIVTELDKPEPENIRYKAKNFQTYNLRVSGFKQEFDKYKNPKPMAGAFVLEDASGREVGRAAGIEHEMKRDIYQNPENWVGKLVQVVALPPLNPGGRLRHPIYNGDADGDLDKV